jgi:hypothetical protein
MVRACNMHLTCETCIHFSLENLKGTDHLEDLGIDVRLIN